MVLYLGQWKALDGSEMILSLEAEIREGREWTEHCKASIVDLGNLDSIPEYYMTDGTWTWQLGPTKDQRKELESFNEDVADGLPTFTVHPFEEFIFRLQTIKNPDPDAPKYARYIDKISYIGQIHPDTLLRVNRDHPDLKLLRIK